MRANSLFPAALLLFALFLVACSAAEEIVPTGTRIIEATTIAPTRTSPSVAVTTATPGPASVSGSEETLTEVEYPPQMRFGDSDIVRLSVIPSAGEYVVVAEFPEHETITDTVAFTQPDDYDILMAGRLDSVGFSISPSGEQVQDWRSGEPMTWRWSISPRRAGQQRLSLTLTMHWRPRPGNQSPSRQSIIFSKGLNVNVLQSPGETIQQALLVVAVGLLAGIVLIGSSVWYIRSRRPVARSQTPNIKLIIEPHPEVVLTSQEARLFQALFHRYARLVVELEFRSGYSGARTFLTLPILADGRSDAYAVAKVGDRETIEREYDNYQTYVKHTLPPVTARIQGRPVVAADESSWLSVKRASSQAAIRYTFIGDPSRKPVSLRQQMLRDPNPGYLEKLFHTFGPNWWMQRRPNTFRLLQEYDRKLPSHYTLEPTQERGQVLDGRAVPSEISLKVGDIVTLRNFEVVEQKAAEEQFSLCGKARSGQVPLRLRWHSHTKPEGTGARVVATRYSLLQEWTAEFDLLGLADPLDRLPVLLSENVAGTQSTIHGDLNLENILIGPGEIVWLIDFANTREGHPIYDFAHLATEIVAHILSPRFTSGSEYLAYLSSDGSSLLRAVSRIAGRCQFDPDEPREYWLAFYISCLGALKYRNLDGQARYFLFLTAAWLADLIN